MDKIRKSIPKEFHKAVLSVGPAPFEIVGKYFSL